MKEVNSIVSFIRTECLCPECEAPFQYTGNGDLTNSMFEHLCPKCNVRIRFPVIYPIIKENAATYPELVTKFFMIKYTGAEKKEHMFFDLKHWELVSQEDATVFYNEPPSSAIIKIVQNMNFAYEIVEFNVK